MSAPCVSLPLPVVTNLKEGSWSRRRFTRPCPHCRRIVSKNRYQDDAVVYPLDGGGIVLVVDASYCRNRRTRSGGVGRRAGVDVVFGSGSAWCSWVTNDRGVNDRSWIAGDVVGSDEFRMGISTTVGHRVRTRRRCFIFDDLHKYIGVRPRVSGCHYAMDR